MTATVSLAGVVKYLGSSRILHGLDLQVAEGEILGLLGPNGSGKTTTLRVMAGYYAPERGEVRICGMPLPPGRGSALVGYLPERAPLYDALTVRQYLDFVAAAKIPAASGGRGRRRAAVARSLDAFGLAGVAGKAIGRLSKGYRQRVGLAQAILNDPPVLLLDEATNGLDPVQIVEARALIRECSKGRAVVFSSHLMQEVDALCTRAAVLRQGRLVADGPTRPAADSYEVAVRAADPGALSRALAGLAAPACAAAGPAAPGVHLWRVDLAEGGSLDEALRVFLRHGEVLSVAPGGTGGSEARFLRALEAAGPEGMP